MATAVTFEKKLDFDSEMKTATLSEGEAEAYLGDLLLHTHRSAEAETHLQQALTLSPGLPMAEASLGMLRVRQGKTEDARQHLQKAIEANSKNYLAHFYYAFALSGLSMDEFRFVSSYPDDVAQAMRAELRKAIELKPDYAESYSLLGFVNMVRGEEVDETIELLKRALTISRANQRIVFMLAQLYLRKENFAEARKLLQPIAKNGAAAELRQQAQSLLDRITRTEQAMESFKAIQRDAAARGDASQRGSGDAPPRLVRRGAESSSPPTESTESDWNTPLSEALRKRQSGETRVQGVLTNIECNAKGITFVLRVNDRLLKFHADNFEHLTITAFTREVSGELTCGPRKPENQVVMTYVAAKDNRRIDGEVAALEFVPSNFVLKQ